MSTEEIEAKVKMLKEGLDLVKKLTNPAYTAQAEYGESDEEWISKMLACAPDPKAFRAGVCMHVHQC